MGQAGAVHWEGEEGLKRQQLNAPRATNRKPLELPYIALAIPHGRDLGETCKSCLLSQPSASPLVLVVYSPQICAA